MFYGPPSGGPSVLSGQGKIQVVGIRPNVTVLFENVTITGGFADEGAGIFNQGNLALENATVTGNVGRLGAGVYSQGTLFVADAAIKDNTVHKSSNLVYPGYSGAGIYLDGGTADLYGGAVVSGNKANDDGQQFGDGGGVYIYSGTLTMHKGSLVTGNHAATHGGGIYNIGGQATLNAGSSVTGNVTAGTGGGIYNEDGFLSPITIANRTIVTGNTPDNCVGGNISNCSN